MRALVWGVLLLRHVCRAIYYPGLNQGGSGTSHSQNSRFWGKAAEMLEASPLGSSLLACHPSCQHLAGACCAGYLCQQPREGDAGPGWP